MAASFSGDDSVTVPSIADEVFSTDGSSVTFWFDTDVNRKASFVGKRTTCDVSPFFDVRSNPGTMEFAISDSSANHVVDAPYTAGWHFFAAIRADDWIELWVDGSLRERLTVPAIDLENSLPFEISGSPCIGIDGTLPLLGELDDLRVYERALNRIEVMSFVPDLIFADGFESGDTSIWPGLDPP